MRTSIAMPPVAAPAAKAVTPTASRSAAAADTLPANGGSQRSEASKSIFATLLKAEQAVPDQAADPGATTLAVRFEGRIFQMHGRAIDMSTVQATPLADLPSAQQADALAALRNMGSGLPFHLPEVKGET